MITAHYRGNMHALHGWGSVFAFTLLLTGLAAGPAFAVPQRIVSTFLCTDEYVFRMVPRARIAALSFEAGDRHPVVSTIADRVAGIPQIHPTTETVLNYDPDLVVLYAGTNTRLHAHLAEIGVPVLDVPWANSLADIRKVTRLVGDKLGARDRAEAMIAAMDATLALARAAAPKPPVRTLIYEANGYATAGNVLTELMAGAGLADGRRRSASTAWDAFRSNPSWSPRPSCSF